MVQFSRRQFMKVTGSTLAGSSLAVMGFSPATALAEVRQYKLVGSTVPIQVYHSLPQCLGGPPQPRYTTLYKFGEPTWQKTGCTVPC